MARDDYYVIVYKILAYLYTILKKGEEIDINMISHEGELFNIKYSYWLYIMEHMLEDKYISGINIKKTFGRDVIITNWDYLQITPKGIAYLCDNNLMEKAKHFLKEIKEK